VIFDTINSLTTISHEIMGLEAAAAYQILAAGDAYKKLLSYWLGMTSI